MQYICIDDRSPCCCLSRFGVASVAMGHIFEHKAGRAAVMSGEGGGTERKAQSRERLQRDGFNDTKYKIVLTLDRLKAL